MKELSIEDKAKRYDDVVYKLKRFITQGIDPLITRADVQDFFPELKESEDDDIKKWLIGYFNQYIIDGMPQVFGNGLNVKDVIAWLEKQGEQKSADNIEPKFKVDDWIVNKGNSYLIGYIDYEQRRYLFEIGGYTHEQLNWEYIENADNKYHLWTIQDAKDGDVLATDSWLYVFKCTNNKALIQFHCNCPIKGKPYKWCFLPDDCYLDIYIGKNIHPATKEQRELLFQKIKEAGYEWDAEKKELKKIKQILANSAKTCKDEQTPAWSEEDEKIALSIEQVMNCVSFLNIVPDKIDKIRTWLKSLRPKNNR